MSNIKGSSAVEMIFVLLVFLAFLTVIQKFSILAVNAHKQTFNHQNRVDLFSSGGAR